MKWTLAIGLVAAMAGPAAAAVEQISGEPCAATVAMGLTERDEYRISHLTTSRTQGLAEAMRSDTARDRDLLAEMFAGGLSPLGRVATGKYQCRTIKLGGNVPLVVYQRFSCEIGQEDATYTLRKLTGSQNFFGTLTPAGAGFLYKGALNYGYEKQVVAYGTNKDRDQVGCLTKDYEDGGRLLLELPMPVFESRHDVIELKYVGK